MKRKDRASEMRKVRRYSRFAGMLCSFLAILLCLAMTADMTYAWLETSVNTKSVLSVGEVDFTLDWDVDLPAPIDSEAYDYVLPAGAYTATLKNDGSVEGWCTLTLTELDPQEEPLTAVYWTEMQETDEELTLSLILGTQTGLQLESHWSMPEEMMPEEMILLGEDEEILFGKLRYQICFEPGEGSGTMESVTQEAGIYVLPQCAFTAPEGMIFQAWKIGEETFASGTEMEITSDLTLHAVWIQDVPAEPEQTGVYTIIFESEGQELHQLTTVDGVLTTFPEDPQSEGYVFAGWFTDLQSGEQIDENFVFSVDARVYARWTAPDNPPSNEAPPVQADEQDTQLTEEANTPPAEHPPEKADEEAAKTIETTAFTNQEPEQNTSEEPPLEDVME